MLGNLKKVTKPVHSQHPHRKHVMPRAEVSSQ
jgi:hypothetical protein